MEAYRTIQPVHVSQKIQIPLSVAATFVPYSFFFFSFCLRIFDITSHWFLFSLSLCVVTCSPLGPHSSFFLLPFWCTLLSLPLSLFCLLTQPFSIPVLVLSCGLSLLVLSLCFFLLYLSLLPLVLSLALSLPFPAISLSPLILCLFPLSLFRLGWCHVVVDVLNTFPPGWWSKKKRGEVETTTERERDGTGVKELKRKRVVETERETHQTREGALKRKRGEWDGKNEKKRRER